MNPTNIPRAEKLKAYANALNEEIEDLMVELEFRINKTKKLTQEILKCA